VRRVLPKRPEQIALERGRVASEADQARAEIVVGIPPPTEREPGPMQPEHVVPRIGEEPILELEP
jgi:hypothetical protein